MSTEAPPLPMKAVMFGIDGLSRPFMGAPVVQQCMPNLAQIMGTWSTGSLMSTLPAYTGPAWTTITTGVNPGRHGIFGFTDRAGDPISDARVGAARVWDYVGRAGGRSIVVNVPVTHPPRPIEGLFVAGMPVPPGTPFTHPESLARDLNSMSGGYIIDESILGTPRIKTTFERLRMMTEARGRAIKGLMTSQSWDLLAFVFVLPDRLGHPWWKYIVPGTPVYESRAGQEVRNQAQPVLRSLDNAIGEIMAAVPSGTAVVLCSDHGFGPLRADIFFDITLADAGLIERPRRSGIVGVAGRMGRTQIARIVPRSILNRAKARMSSDSGGRRAWTAPKYDRAVRLADPDDEKIRARVVDLLEGLREPNGRPIVSSVRTREEAFSGPFVADAAELFPEMATEDLELHEGLHAGSSWLSREETGWGTHAKEGVVAITGAGTLGAIEGDAADITPTLLALMGLRAEGLDGRSLVSKDRATTAVTAEAPEGTDTAYSEDEQAAVMEHLKGLGYVE